MGGQILELENISKSFDDTVILDDFTYSFKKGEKVGIIGKTVLEKARF
jgi:ABC transport system ATP-binding/permease protein